MWGLGWAAGGGGHLAGLEYRAAAATPACLPTCCQASSSCCSCMSCLLAVARHTSRLPPVAVWAAALQQFAWTEAEVPGRLAARSAAVQGGVGEGEPLFCVETALKLTYVSLHMYRHFRVSLRLICQLRSAAADAAAPTASGLACLGGVPCWVAAQHEATVHALPRHCCPLQPESTISSMDTLLGLYGLRWAGCGRVQGLLK